MAIKVRKGKQPKARRVLVYGENGSGKSTLASRFPNPIFLNLEEGLNDIDCTSTDQITDLGTYCNNLVELYYSDYETIVTDTADWLEKLIFSQVAAKHGKSTIDDIGFGKGYQAVEGMWVGILQTLGVLWDQGRHIVFTCHETIDKFQNPDGDSFNYWRPSLHAKGSGCVTEWCDEVLFLKKKTIVVNKDEGFNKTRGVAMDGGRVIVCSKQPTCEAKNRLGLPSEVPHNYELLNIPKVSLIVPEQNGIIEASPTVASGNIEGIIVNGSSKQPASSVASSSFDSPF